jgi:hypothetical protein
MCCGKNRTQMRAETPTGTKRATIPTTNASPVRAEGVGGRPAGPTAPRRAGEKINSIKPNPQPVAFVYGGKTGMTVVGPVSGRVYRFDRPGAQVSVDARDKFLLATIPNLMMVK